MNKLSSAASVGAIATSSSADPAGLTLLMPAAGAGSRFAQAGWRQPKPLIEIASRPMAFWPLACAMATWPRCRVVIVTLRAHEAAYGVSRVLHRHVPRAQMVLADELTGGSLQTCLLARPVIGGGRLIVLDCDLAFRSTGFVRAVNDMDGGPGAARGVLMSFAAQDARFSYAEAVNGEVLRTAEKQVISDRALVGAYAFASAAEFFELAAEMVRENARVANGEFYTSDIYNRLIRRGGRVRLTDADQFWSFGTPEELAARQGEANFQAFARALTEDAALADVPP